KLACYAHVCFVLVISNILNFFLTKFKITSYSHNTAYRVKDGSGALLWAAFFWQAIKSGNVQPDP
ncbi:hypothetical protein, partial [Flavobacterium sp.]|uniref:hypothetical protein n=1 Tax=Flavobacterium sp. TaxID=239 RepID=UPI001B484D02